MLHHTQSFEQPDDIVLHIAGKKITPGKGKYSLKGKGTPGPVVAELFQKVIENGELKSLYKARLEEERKRQFKDLLYGEL